MEGGTIKRGSDRGSPITLPFADDRFLKLCKPTSNLFAPLNWFGQGSKGIWEPHTHQWYSNNASMHRSVLFTVHGEFEHPKTFNYTGLYGGGPPQPHTRLRLSMHRCCEPIPDRLSKNKLANLQPRLNFLQKTNQTSFSVSVSLGEGGGLRYQRISIE